MHKLPVRHLTAILSDEEGRALKGTLLEPHQIATIVSPKRDWPHAQDEYQASSGMETSCL